MAVEFLRIEMIGEGVLVPELGHVLEPVLFRVVVQELLVDIRFMSGLEMPIG